LQFVILQREINAKLKEAAHQIQMVFLRGRRKMIFE